jgi:hypothetical protein
MISYLLENRAEIKKKKNLEIRELLEKGNK